MFKVITQILTWAFPGVQVLFGPNQQDFSQPPPQSAAGTRLPPYPGEGTSLSHSCMCCSADQPADHTPYQDWVFFSQFHLQMLRATNLSLQALATESLTSSQNFGLARSCFADKSLNCIAIVAIVMHSPAIWICLQTLTLALSKTHPWGQTKVHKDHQQQVCPGTVATCLSGVSRDPGTSFWGCPVWLIRSHVPLALLSSLSTAVWET